MVLMKEGIEFGWGVKIKKKYRTIISLQTGVGDSATAAPRRCNITLRRFL